MMIRAQLNPQSTLSVSEETLAIDWTLSPQDIKFIYKHCSHHPADLLHFAIQLCFLQRKGKFIQDYNKVPIAAMSLAVQKSPRVVGKNSPTPDGGRKHVKKQQN